MDSDAQWMVQQEARYREAMLKEMDAPLWARDIALDLLAAMECRRGGREHPLIALPEGARNLIPFREVLRFRAYVVKAAIALREAGRHHSLDSAYQYLSERLAWIEADPQAKQDLGGQPSAEAIRGWYEDRVKDTRFGRLYPEIDRELPAGLIGVDMVDWLIESVSSATGGAYRRTSGG